jgi:hypothetical protein
METKQEQQKKKRRAKKKAKEDEFQSMKALGLQERQEAETLAQTQIRQKEIDLNAQKQREIEKLDAEYKQKINDMVVAFRKGKQLYLEMQEELAKTKQAQEATIQKQQDELTKTKQLQDRTTQLE